jgi:hypothetical protein
MTSKEGLLFVANVVSYGIIAVIDLPDRMNKGIHL